MSTLQRISATPEFAPASLRARGQWYRLTIRRLVLSQSGKASGLVRPRRNDFQQGLSPWQNCCTPGCESPPRRRA